MSILQVGFVGLGSQGGPMAQRIIEEGFATTLWARRSETLRPFEGTGATFASERRQLGAASDVLCVCVVADDDVNKVLRGDDGALAGMEPGGAVVIHSTVHPETCRRLQADFPHLSVLDAPVSGGGHKAAAKELMVMVGGDADVLDRCRPVLEAFASPLVHLGDLGAGQEAKLLNNSAFTAQLGIAADAFALAMERGLDPDALAIVLSEGSGRSYAAEVIAGCNYSLRAFADLAGALLAKDVALLSDISGSSGAVLTEVAKATVESMGLEHPR